MSSLLQRFAGLSKILTAVVVVALVAAAVIVFSSRGNTHYMTVDFPRANSLYKGSDVRILGVPVGTVEKLTPKGDHVKVELSYDAKYKVPKDVKVEIISPSIVGDRFVQLVPAYNGGAVLPDRASIGEKRTAVPVELDQVYNSLDDLSVALGPKGANKDGSLSRFLKSGAETLDGQGEQVHETIKNFSKLSQTLSDNKDELFGGVREVEDFIAMLKRNDDSVRAFNDSTAQVSKVLAGEREDLAGTIKALGLALRDVKTLVKDNRAELGKNVDNLEVTSKTLTAHMDSVKEMVYSAPTALSNVAFTYNGLYGTLDTRADLSGLLKSTLGDPQALLCQLLGETPSNAADGSKKGTKKADPKQTLCDALKPLLDPLGKLTSKLPLPRAAVATPPREQHVNSSLEEMLAVK